MKVYTLLTTVAFATGISASAAVQEWSNYDGYPGPSIDSTKMNKAVCHKSRTSKTPSLTISPITPTATYTASTISTTTTTTTTTTTSPTTTTSTTTTTISTTTTTTTSDSPTCVIESQVCDPTGTALPTCCTGAPQCVRGVNAYFCRNNCVPDGGACSLSDPGACCGQVCLVDGYCITI